MASKTLLGRPANTLLGTFGSFFSDLLQIWQRNQITAVNLATVVLLVASVYVSYQGRRRFIYRGFQFLTAYLSQRIRGDCHKGIPLTVSRIIGESSGPRTLLRARSTILSFRLHKLFRLPASSKNGIGDR